MNIEKNKIMNDEEIKLKWNRLSAYREAISRLCMYPPTLVDEYGSLYVDVIAFKRCKNAIIERFCQ